MFNSRQPPRLQSVLIASGIILSLAMGVRHGFGFWLQPMSQHHEWTRETFSLAMAMQNLLWGVFGPFAGMAADRFGAARVVFGGALLYMAGLLWMAVVGDGQWFALGSGVLMGAAMACTAFGALSGIVGRTAPVAQRSWAFGLLGAAGSFGQFAMVPVEQMLIDGAGWQSALYWLAALVVVTMMPLSLLLREPPPAAGSQSHQQSIVEAVREAFGHRPFQLLVAGYFVCGFQVVFIGVHLPAYLKDQGIVDPQVAVIALALIGLFNIFGSFYAGKLGGRLPKPSLLSGIYFARALIIAAFVLLPLSPLSVYVFAASMGLIWLSTVPLTNGVIAGIFGVRYLSMLSGFVFFSHQVGSFLGVWLGGYLYTVEGSYQTVWMITIALGVGAGLLNLPVSEAPIERGKQAAA
ncbi:MAG: MFS transporter [Burkholderiaceae bacterium]|nr:MFS transporter [Burkholderiaceae bacterium]